MVHKELEIYVVIWNVQNEVTKLGKHVFSHVYILCVVANALVCAK